MATGSLLPNLCPVQSPQPVCGLESIWYRLRDLIALHIMSGTDMPTGSGTNLRGGFIEIFVWRRVLEEALIMHMN